MIEHDALQLMLGMLAVLASFLAIFINQWITPLPWLGINFQYRRKIIQFVIAVTAISITGVIVYSDPSTRNLVFFVLTLLLTPLSGFNYAKKFLVSLTDPYHAAISEIDWSADQLVLGHTAENGEALAWTLDVLRPHHLVNDWLAGKPVMAGW
jgi:hypothetical protein